MDYEKEIRKLEAQIEKAEAQIKELKVEAEQEAPPVWTPDFAEAYYFADSGEVSKYHFYDDFVDNNCLKVGNLFETKQEAEDYTRALALIETIRRERYKAQGHWWPGEYETRYTVCWKQLGNSIDTSYASLTFSSNVFGFWRDLDVLYGVIKKHESELKWYFTEYLPSIN